jgi:hypothetical protein
MRTIPKLMVACLAIAALSPATVIADGGSATRRAAFQVSVRVPPVVELDASSAPASFVLDATDLAAGFKDVVARYRVRSNLPGGYLLRFDRRNGIARDVEVNGLGAPLAVGPLGAEALQAGPAARDAEVSLTFRVHVEPGLAPGRYPLPVVVSAAAF